MRPEDVKSFIARLETNCGLTLTRYERTELVASKFQISHYRAKLEMIRAYGEEK